MSGRLPDGSPGPQPGAGRRPGTRNRKTIRLLERLEETKTRLEELQGVPFAGDAHDLLTQIYKDQSLPVDVRLDAAKSAIRYEKPALASEERTVKGEIGHYHAIPVAERDAITVATVAEELVDD
jgi:hypothetical protein